MVVLLCVFHLVGEMTASRQYVSFLCGVIQLVQLARWQQAVCFISVWCYSACVFGKMATGSMFHFCLVLLSVCGWQDDRRQDVSFLFGVIQRVWLASSMFHSCLVLSSVCGWQAVCFIPVWCYLACVVGKQYVSFLFGVIQCVWLASGLFQFCLVLFSYCSCHNVRRTAASTHVFDLLTALGDLWPPRKPEAA